MTQFKLDGYRVAILATDGFEESELVEPKRALVECGAQVDILSPKNGTIRSWKENNWGEAIAVDREIFNVSPDDYDAVMLPGGVMNPDSLRTCQEAVAFVRAFDLASKPIAAICHGPQLLIEAGVVRGRTVTSWPSLKTDLNNAGAYWMDAEVCHDRGLVTSRKPSDIPAFTRVMVEKFGEDFHLRQRRSA